jgi:hypothetical protein
MNGDDIYVRDASEISQRCRSAIEHVELQESRRQSLRWNGSFKPDVLDRSRCAVPLMRLGSLGTEMVPPMITDLICPIRSDHGRPGAEELGTKRFSVVAKE